MSTKIYNGFIFSDKINSLEKAFDSLKEMKDLLVETADKHWLSLIVRFALAEFDNCADEEIVDKNFINDSRSYLLDYEFEARKNNRHNLTDVEFSVCIANIKIKNKNRIVGMYYSGNRELITEFCNFPTIEEYGYWDNTDPPDDISYTEFKKRGIVWDKILSFSDIPAESMLSFVLISPTPRIIFNDKIIKDGDQYILSYEDRLENAAKFRVNKRVVFPEKASDIIRYLKSEEYQKLIDNEKIKLKKILKQNVTIKDLLNEN